MQNVHALTSEQFLAFQVQFIELFCESDPSERAGAFDSLEEAIAATNAASEQPIQDKPYCEGARIDHAARTLRSKAAS